MSMGGRSEGGRRNPLVSDLLALHTLVFPLSFPFGLLPRSLHNDYFMMCSGLAFYPQRLPTLQVLNHSLETTQMNNDPCGSSTP